MNHSKARGNDELSFRIANHSFTVVEADASYVKLFETNTLIDNTRTNQKCSVENQTRARMPLSSCWLGHIPLPWVTLIIPLKLVFLNMDTSLSLV
ncbi:hypothetical protein GQ457_16G010180 [Hibiscus cannabinus]